MAVLTPMEQRALLGAQAIGRELAQQHAQQQEALRVDFLDMLREIAIAHDLPEAAFDGDYGINTQTWEIVPTAPPEEAMTTPAEAYPVTEAA